MGVDWSNDLQIAQIRTTNWQIGAYIVQTLVARQIYAHMLGVWVTIRIRITCVMHEANGGQYNDARLT